MRHRERNVWKDQASYEGVTPLPHNPLECVPPYPSRVASLVARFPIPCLLPHVRGSPYGLVVRWTPPTTPGLLVVRSPNPGMWARREVALPSSRVTPMKTCPALRPRWCPDCSPSRLQDCCLPAGGNRRLSPPDDLEGYPCVHNDILFVALSRGLPPRSLQLRTSIAGCARGVCS